MLLNVNLNDTAQKMMWSEDVQTCKRIRNNMSTTGSTTSPFENFNGENPISLVHSRSSDVLDTLLNGTS